MSKIQNSQKGFSLVEVLVALFVFSLVMTMMTKSFASFFKSYVNAKKIQKDVENGQYAMNLMAKTLRTSNLVTTSFPLRTFDYSQGKCIQYDYVGKKIQTATTKDVSPTNPSACNWGNMNVSSDLTPDNIANASIFASATNIAASPVIFGKVTIMLSVRDKSNVTAAIPIQTTVSLRQ